MKSLEMGEEGSKYRHESGDSALEILQNIYLKAQKHPTRNLKVVILVEKRF